MKSHRPSRARQKRKALERHPNLSAETIETSCPMEWLRLIDPQEARAIELEAIGDDKRARSIRECVSPLEEYGYTCRDRRCPSCSARKAAKYAARAVKVIRDMRRPKLLLVTLCSLGLDDLRGTIAELRRLLTLLRRKRLRSVRVAIGCIEPQLSRKGARWTPHLHVVVDVDALPFAVLRDEWRALTNGRGTFDADSRIHLRGVDPRNPYALARYLFKSTDACPPPGTVAPEVLSVLWGRQGIHGAQLPVWWGGQRGRNGHRRRRA